MFSGGLVKRIGGSKITRIIEASASSTCTRLGLSTPLGWASGIAHSASSKAKSSCGSGSAHTPSTISYCVRCEPSRRTTGCRRPRLASLAAAPDPERSADMEASRERIVYLIGAVRMGSAEGRGECQAASPQLRRSGDGPRRSVVDHISGRHTLRGRGSVRDNRRVPSRPNLGRRPHREERHHPYHQRPTSNEARTRIL